jgi:serine/threonine-protein kinase RsbW
MMEAIDMRVPHVETVELRMDARPENLVLARLALGGVAARTPLGDDVVADLKLAVTEACTNAIEHAYAGDPGSNEIVVRFALDDGALSVEVQDWGVGFDTEVEPPRDEELEELRDHAGVGLMLIRSLTDELTIESGGAGSTIAFSKRLMPPE